MADRRRRPRPTDDGGSAVVEFVFVAVLLLVPLAYVLLAVFAVQRAAYALTTASREAARAYVTAGADGGGEARALRAAELALGDQGLRLADAVPTFDCDRRPCLRPGGRVTVRIETRVPLPFLGGSWAGGPASIGVSAQHVEVIDRHRSLG